VREIIQKIPIINKNSVVPIYYQLKEYIKDQIDSENLNVGEMIPSERELAEEFEINRMTVRQAVNELVNEGHLRRQRGVGTFVSKSKINQGLSRLSNFTTDMMNKGMKPGAKLLSMEVIPAPKKIAAKLQIPEGEQVVELFRLRIADGEPMALERSYLPYSKVSPIMNEDMEKQSLYKVLEEKCQLKLLRALQTIEISYSNPTDAHYLEIGPDSPVLLIERVTFLEDDQPIECVSSIYRSDRYKFSIEMNI
jgi:GntR family transcriptional regulator